jgi:ABC-type antimicrobial peptide transport system permease subunit
MSGAKQVCALEGCENLIEVTSAQARRYCCAAHRKIARKQRREQLGEAQPGEAQPGEAQPGGADIDLEPVTAPIPVLAAVAAGASEDTYPARSNPWLHLDPPTAPIPVLTPTGATVSASRGTGASAEPGPPYRRLVPEPTPRWFRRSASRPYAARGVRPRYAHRPLLLLPEGLRPRPPRRPASRPHTPRDTHPVRPHDTQPPLPSLPQWLPPYFPSCPAPAPAAVLAPAAVPAPATAAAPLAAPAPAAGGRAVTMSDGPNPTAGSAVPATLSGSVRSARSAVTAVLAVVGLVLATCRGAVARSGHRVTATLAGRRGKLADRRAQRHERKIESETLRRQAAAMLVGAPIPGLVEAAPGRRRGRRAVKLAAPSVPLPGVQVAWLSQMQEALSAALHSLSNNRLRSLLTTFGIIAGVAAVIVLVAMGDGMTKGFNDQWSPFATQLTINPITGPVATGKAPQHLTDNDLHALQDPQKAPDVATLSPAVASNSVTLAVGQQKAGAQLFGIVENYLNLANRHMTAGTWFTPEQINAGTRDAVIGPQVLNALWGPATDPNSVIGQQLRVGHSSFQIQGVVNSDGQNDNVVMVPLDAARAFVVGNNAGKLDVIIAKSSNVQTLEAAKSEIFQILYTQHHVRVDTDRDFNVTDNTNILQQQSQSIKFMSMFILAVAAISLFVGGVGVANIMLVSVTERTREIGIRKAIGAPRRAIMRQFLSEAVMLTALGGLIGSIFGVGLCLLGKVIIPKLWPPDPSSLTPTPLPLLTLDPVLIAFAVSLVIGLLAGGYPAYRAARLRPIEALRFE